MSKEFSQHQMEIPEKTLADFFDIKGGTLNLLGVLQTQNFISGKRGVQIRNEGLNSSGGTIQGATISGSNLQGGTTITALTNSTGGSADNTVAAVGNTSSSDQSGVINNNFADLTVKLDAVISALQSLGILT